MSQLGGTKAVYRYDVLTDTYTQLADIPYHFYNGSAVVIGDMEEIYAFGGTVNPTDVQILELNSADYEDNQVVISQGVGKYVTDLIVNENNIKYWFNNAWIYTKQNGLIKGLPTYYGNGTSWVKFKN